MDMPPPPARSTRDEHLNFAAQVAAIVASPPHVNDMSIDPHLFDQSGRRISETQFDLPPASGGDGGFFGAEDLEAMQDMFDVGGDVDLDNIKPDDLSLDDITPEVTQLSPGSLSDIDLSGGANLGSGSTGGVVDSGPGPGYTRELHSSDTMDPKLKRRQQNRLASARFRAKAKERQTELEKYKAMVAQLRREKQDLIEQLSNLKVSVGQERDNARTSTLSWIVDHFWLRRKVHLKTLANSIRWLVAGKYRKGMATVVTDAMEANNIGSGGGAQFPGTAVGPKEGRGDSPSVAGQMGARLTSLVDSMRMRRSSSQPMQQ